MARKKKSSSVGSIPTPQRKNVDLKKAKNGYVVSSWDGTGEQVYIAKTKDEALKYVSEIMGLKSRGKK